jgi:iron complex transport system substrate-binding protein
VKSKPGKLLATLLVAALTLTFAVSCATEAEDKTQAAIEITDQLGRTVTLEQPAQRILSLAPNNTEILFALDEEVVGVTEYCDYPPEAQTKTIIGGFSNPNIEEIVALEPDLILVTTMHEDILPQMEGMGLTVMALAPQVFEDVYEGIEIVGRATGKETEAAALRADMEGRVKAITDLTDAIPEDERPGVFYLTWHDPLMTSGGDTLINELIEMAGGTNIFEEVPGSEIIDLEVLITRNPQVCIVGIGMVDEGEEELGLLFFETEERLQNTDAVKNDRIYGIHLDLTGRAGPRLVDGLEAFARAIHPELFE